MRASFCCRRMSKVLVLEMERPISLLFRIVVFRAAGLADASWVEGVLPKCLALHNHFQAKTHKNKPLLANA